MWQVSTISRSLSTQLDTWVFIQLPYNKGRLKTVTYLTLSIHPLNRLRAKMIGFVIDTNITRWPSLDRPRTMGVTGMASGAPFSIHYQFYRADWFITDSLTRIADGATDEWRNDVPRWCNVPTKWKFAFSATPVSMTRPQRKWRHLIWNELKVSDLNLTCEEEMSESASKQLKIR